MSDKFPMRLNKYLALRGVASRRKADELITDGKVNINGKVASLGDQVHEHDQITYTGSAVTRVLYAYYKPKGIETIASHPLAKDIKKLISVKEEVFPIGRLDKDSEGLILLTNDGLLTKEILDPESKTEKEYRVTLDKPISHTLLMSLKQGIKLNIGNGKKVTTLPAQVRRINPYTFDIILEEGKNRQIRKMCGTFGYKVNQLIRFRIGNITLEKLKPGQLHKIDWKK